MRRAVCSPTSQTKGRGHPVRGRCTRSRGEGGRRLGWAGASGRGPGPRSSPPRRTPRRQLCRSGRVPAGPAPGACGDPAQAGSGAGMDLSKVSPSRGVPPAGPRPGVPAATALRARGAPSERRGRTPHSPRRRTRPQQLPQVRCVPPTAGKGHRVRRRRARGTPGKRKERRPGPVRPGPLRTTAPQAAASRPAGSLKGRGDLRLPADPTRGRVGHCTHQKVLNKVHEPADPKKGPGPCLR